MHSGRLIANINKIDGCHMWLLLYFQNDMTFTEMGLRHDIHVADIHCVNSNQSINQSEMGEVGEGVVWGILGLFNLYPPSFLTWKK